MKYKTLETKHKISMLLKEAEQCMEKWDETDLSLSLTASISPIIRGLLEHIDDDQVSRREIAGAAFRAITDAYVIEESDAAQLVLRAIEIYSKYV